MSDEAMARKTQIGTIFDRLAPHYDAGPGCFAHFGRRLVDLVGIEPGQRVLDVAVGRGAVLFPAAERARPAGEVVGIDLSAGMVRATGTAAEQRGIGAHVQVMDAEQLDFPDQTFDRVLCGFGLMFFPDQARALAECRRVLRPGGRLGVSTWQRSQTADLEDVLRELGLPGLNEPGWITEAATLQHLLEQADFSEVQVLPDAASFRYADLEQYWQLAHSTGLRRVLDGLDPEQTERVRNALAHHVRPQQRDTGLHLVATALLATASR
jgi:ubiquinone/menaquinone biosynthesis C-methylase UbiE